MEKGLIINLGQGKYKVNHLTLPESKRILTNKQEWLGHVKWDAKANLKELPVANMEQHCKQVNKVALGYNPKYKINIYLFILIFLKIMYEY